MASASAMAWLWVVPLVFIAAPGNSYLLTNSHQNKNRVPLFPWLHQKEHRGLGLLRLKGAGKFDENHAVTDVIQRNSRKSANLPPSAFETLVASTLFQAQVKNDGLRMLKYLHVVSARSFTLLQIAHCGTCFKFRIDQNYKLTIHFCFRAPEKYLI
jgi:hypothetical protein